MSCRDLYQITEALTDRDRASDVSTWLVGFFGRWTPVIPGRTSPPSIVSKQAQREGGEGSVMNERHWRTPKAVISDPPPTTQHRQKDNKRKKKVTSQASKQGHSVRDESCISCYPDSSSSFYFDLKAEPLYLRYSSHIQLCFWFCTRCLSSTFPSTNNISRNPHRYIFLE